MKGSSSVEHEAEAGRGQAQRPAEGPPGLLERGVLVVPRHQVGEHELADAGPRGVLGGLPRGEVQALGEGGRRGLVPRGERRLAEQDVRVPGQVDQGLGLAGVRRVGQRPSRVLQPEAERLDRWFMGAAVTRSGPISMTPGVIVAKLNASVIPWPGSAPGRPSCAAGSAASARPSRTAAWAGP